ncbi:MAG TPA: cysteine desulfurase [Firmicutes bacterium]|nr:cysteine desulfurase [Bacillota bacterium]
MIYLDNAATTRVIPDVAEVVQKAMTEAFGNPSSPHTLGLEAERLVRQAREAVAAALGCQADEVYFTSGGTEADNLAIRGTLQAKIRKGKHVVTSAVEHAAVLETLKHLAQLGLCEYTLVPPDSTGKVAPEDVVKAVRDDTVLVTVMTVNNEVGTIQPVAEIARLVKERDPEVCVHSDAVQALGKVRCRVKELGVDLLSISGHKLGAPKGVGGLYCRQGVRIVSQITGGGQEREMRSGTENVPGIVGLGRAVALAMEQMEEQTALWRRLQERLLALLEEIPDAQVMGSPLANAPHIVNVGFPGVRGEVLVHALAAEGLFVSTGSACSSRREVASHVLKAMGVNPQAAEGSIRISFGWENTMEEVERAAELIREAVRDLRRFQRY